MRYLYGIIGLLLVVLMGAGWYFTSVVLHPGKHVCKKDHYVYCGEPAEQSIEFEDVIFDTSDGLTISAWYMPAENSDKAVVLVHGRGATRREGMRYAKSLLAAGFNLLAIDLRHWRQDESIQTTMGYHEKKDVVAAVDFLLKTKNIESIGIMGFSMGAATCMLAMAADKRIEAGIFNSGFANVEDVLAEAGKRDFGLPRYPLIPLVMRIFAFRADIDLDNNNPEDKIGEIAPRPVLIMHGTGDNTVYYPHSQRLYAAAKEPKELWTVEGATHTKLWQVNTPKAEAKVTGFFKANL